MIIALIAESDACWDDGVRRVFVGNDEAQVMAQVNAAGYYFANWPIQVFKITSNTVDTLGESEDITDYIDGTIEAL